jgi:nucleotide-binding universal stress UspA family protein
MEPKILVPVNDSPTARATIESIIALKKRFPRTITLLYVINKDQLAYRMIPEFQLEMVRENAQKAGKALLNKYSSKLVEEGFVPEIILELGTPQSVIANVANRDGFNLLVIGRHEGGGEIRDVLFGSVANYVLHNVKCPVLLF